MLKSIKEKIGDACVIIADFCGWLAFVDPKIIEAYKVARKERRTERTATTITGSAKAAEHKIKRIKTP